MSRYIADLHYAIKLYEMLDCPRMVEALKAELSRALQ